MITSGIFIHPATWFILGAVLLPLAKRFHLQKALLVAVPVMAFIQIYSLPETFGVVNYLGFEIIFGKVDKLTFVFLHVFTLMAIIGCIYGLHVEETGQHIAAFLYVAGSLGVTLAGDYLTLFIFWELMAFSSVFLVWYREAAALHRGGLPLPAGPRGRRADPLRRHLPPLPGAPRPPLHQDPDVQNATLAEYLIMIGFALNAAVPPLHAWLPDAYPRGDRHRRGVHVRLHHQDRRLRPGPRLSRLRGPVPWPGRS